MSRRVEDAAPNYILNSGLDFLFSDPRPLTSTTLQPHVWFSAPKSQMPHSPTSKRNASSESVLTAGWGSTHPFTAGRKRERHATTPNNTLQGVPERLYTLLALSKKRYCSFCILTVTTILRVLKPRKTPNALNPTKLQRSNLDVEELLETSSPELRAAVVWAKA